MKKLARKRRLAIVGIALASCCAGANMTDAAFSPSTRNPSAAFASGTVEISDDDAGASLVTLSGVRPGDGASGCVKVTYTGSVPATVRLYNSSASGTLGSSVGVIVTRGTMSNGFPSCSNFTPDSTVHVAGQPPGLIWSGTLSSLPTTYGTGVVDPNSSSPATWTATTTRAYRFDFVINDGTTSNNKSVASTLTWEARNT